MRLRGSTRRIDTIGMAAIGLLKIEMAALVLFIAYLSPANNALERTGDAAANAKEQCKSGIGQTVWGTDHQPLK